jgi:SpoVK/Ycf46/Vps4 family AAA+-type ATPase
MEKVSSALSEADIETIVERTEGYSGADMKILCQEASLGPVRSVDPEDIATIDEKEVIPTRSPPESWTIATMVPPITYYWTCLLILDLSYLVGNLTNSKISDKTLDRLES